MPGGSATPPPPAAVPIDAATPAALRARLLDVEARLSQTQLDLTAAQTALHAVPSDNAGGQGGAPAGVGAGGGAPADGVAANAGAGGAAALGAAVPPAPLGGIPPAAGDGDGGQANDDAPLGDDALADYANPDDGDRESDGVDGWGPHRWGGPPIGGGRHRAAGRGRATIDEAGAYDDGFDFQTSFSASDWLQSFDIPRSVLRADGLPMPFTPCDPVHAATFTAGSRDELEARHLYCTLSWTQTIFNDLLAAQHADGNSKEVLEELVDYLVCSTRRIYALGVSRYDYLALRQSEPNLADAFAHADAVPRNSLRGDGARRFISRVVRAETAASAKVGAAERGYSYPKRGGRAPAPGAPGRARSPARRGGAGGRGGARVGGGGGGGGGGGAGRGRGGGRA